MKRWFVSAMMLSVLVGIACSSSSGDDGSAATDAGGSSDASATDANDATTFGDSGGSFSDAGTGDAGAPVPTHQAASLAYIDHDFAIGHVQGTVTIGKAVDESDVTTYDLYWVTSALGKVQPITTLPKTGADLTYSLTVDIPSGASGLLVLTSNAAGEMAHGASLGDVDDVPRYLDISGGFDGGAFETMTALLNTTSDELLAVGSLVSGSPLLLHGDVDGGTFGITSTSAGQTVTTFASALGALDTTNAKVDQVSQNSVTNSGSLVRCNLDGSGCVFTNLSSSVGANTSYGWIVPLYDATDNKLLAVTHSYVTADFGYKPALFHCNADGSSCGYTDISGGHEAHPSYTSAVFDTVNKKVIVVDPSYDNVSPEIQIYESNYDGSSPTFNAPSSGVTAFTTRVLIDATNSKLLVFTTGEGNVDGASLISLTICNLAGSSCAEAVSVSASHAANYAFAPVIDTVNQKLLIFFSDDSNSSKLSVTRCALDGTGCTYIDFSAGQGTNSGGGPIAVVDAAHERVLVVTSNGANGQKPALFYAGL